MLRRDFPRVSVMTEWKDGEPKIRKRVHKDRELNRFSISNAVVMRFGVLNRNFFLGVVRT